MHPPIPDTKQAQRLCLQANFELLGHLLSSGSFHVMDIDPLFLYALRSVTALHKTEQDAWKTVQLLIKHGGNIHTQSDTVLTWAMTHNHNIITRNLLELDTNFHIETATLEQYLQTNSHVLQDNNGQRLLSKISTKTSPSFIS